jgi:hypothetical protein
MLKPNRIALASLGESAPDSNAYPGRSGRRKGAFQDTLWRSGAPGTVPDVERRKDTTSARQWLGEGIPLADVLTMLEFGHRLRLSPDACRAYSVEIIFAVWQEIPAMQHLPLAHRKEPHNAVA